MATFQSTVDRVFTSPVFNAENTLGMIAQVSRGSGLCVGSPDESGVIESLTPWETLRRCVLNGHDSVLEFADLCVFITCPIFVARQLMRYRMASYLERSLRYSEPIADDCVNPNASAAEVYKEHEIECREAYDNFVTLLREAPEEARAVLPLSTPTQIVMKANLREWLHIFDQRLAPGAQEETRELVRQIYEIAKDEFPVVIKAWSERNAKGERDEPR